MASDAAESNLEYTPPDPEAYVSAAEDADEPPHAPSLTALAAEAVRTGVVPDSAARRESEIPGEDDLLRAGDPDVDPLENEYAGDEVPGGSTPTPDQGVTDEIGRAYGVTDLDTGALTSTEELLRRRDERRWELDPRSKDPEA